MQRSMHFLRRSTLPYVLIATVLISLQMESGSALAATFSSQSSSSLPQTCNNGEWHLIQSPSLGSNSNWLTADAVLSSTDIWVAGNYNNPYTGLAHSNGKPPWTVINTQNVGFPTGMVAFSDTDIWIVGGPARGGGMPLIEHWDGTSVNAIPTSTPGGLSEDAAVSPTDIWAVGTLIMHYDGTQWSVVPTPVTGVLDGVATVTTNDMWAVGSNTANNAPLIEHWDGTQWSVVAGPNVAGHLHGVAVVSANDVWAVGESLTNTPLIEHWNGKKWSLVSSPGSGALHKIAVVGKDNIWAVGGVNGATLIQHWDGTSWTVIPSPSRGKGDLLRDVVSVPGTKTLYAVGQYVANRQSQPIVEYFSC
jgi:hypothetical protein